MKKVLKRVGFGLAVVMAILLAVILEAGIRDFARRPIAVAIDRNVNAEVEGFVFPDLLWVGEAWCVKVVCDQPVSLDFDGQWRANVPAGQHKIVYNHDWENTTDYAPTRWTKAPIYSIVSIDSLRTRQNHGRISTTDIRGDRLGDCHVVAVF